VGKFFSLLPIPARRGGDTAPDQTTGFIGHFVHFISGRMGFGGRFIVGIGHFVRFGVGWMGFWGGRVGFGSSLVVLVGRKVDFAGRKMGFGG
jgi:hypothetical protein